MGQRRVRRGAAVLGSLWVGVWTACGADPGREVTPEETGVVLPDDVSPPPPPALPPLPPSLEEPEACEGLMPEAHRLPRIISDVLTTVGFPQPEHVDYYACTAPPLTDGEGNLILPIERTRSYMGYVEGTWTFFDPRGQMTGRFEGIRHELIPAARGFQGVLGMARWGAGRLASVNAQGQVVLSLFADGLHPAHGAGGDVHSGSAMVWISREEGTSRVKVVAADAAGARRFGPLEVGRYPSSPESWHRVATGVDRSGRILVVWGGESLFGEGHLAARWLTPEGDFLTPPFDVGEVDMSPPETVRPDYHGYGTLSPLIGGGLVLRGKEGWVRFFPSGEATSEAAPEWLAAWRDRKLEIIRGGRGYALMLDPESPSVWRDGALPSVEIIARDGTACGTWMTPAPSQPPGTVSLGGDGSVLWKAPWSCEVRWWPALLR